MTSYSIVLRVRRVTYEDAYISVPVSDVIMRQGDDGSYRIDPDALCAEGIRISQDSRVEWQVESADVEPHPIQQPVPGGRKTLTASDDA